MPANAISTAQIDELLRHREWLTRLAYRLVGNSSDADDLVQIAMERTIRRPPQRPEALRGWLAQIVRNAASNLRRDQARSERKIRIHEARLAERDDPRRMTVSESTERIELQRMMLEGLTWLPEHHRHPLMLRYERELDHEAVGVEMGITPEAARKRVSRALSALRDSVEIRLGPDWREKLAAVFGLPLPAVAVPMTAFVVMAAAAVLLVGGAWLLIRSAGPSIVPDLSVASTLPDPAALQPSDPAPAGIGQAAAAEMGAGTRTPLPGPPVEVVPTRAVAGRVLDDTGRPIRNVEVYARCSGMEHVDLVKLDGTYSLLLDPSWDDQLVTLIARGKGTSTWIQALGSELAGQTWDLLFRLGSFQRANAFEAETKAAVAGVELHASHGEFVAIGTTGPDGLTGFYLAGDRVYSVTVPNTGFGRHAILACDSAILLSANQLDSAPLEIPLWVSPLRFEIWSVDAVTGQALAPTTYLYRERSPHALDSTGGYLEFEAPDGKLSVENPNPNIRTGVWLRPAGFAPEFVLMNRDLGEPTTVQLEREEDVVVTVLGLEREPIVDATLQWFRSQPLISLVPSEGGSCWVEGSSPIGLGGEASIPAHLDLENLSFTLTVFRNGIAVAESVRVSGLQFSANRTFVLQLETKGEETNPAERRGVLALSGRIEEADGGLVPAGLLATLMTADTREVLEFGFLDLNGRFEFSDLPDRPLLMRIEEGNIPLDEISVRPPARGLTFNLPPFRTLTVHTQDITTAMPPDGLVEGYFYSDAGTVQHLSVRGGRDLLFDRLPQVPGRLMARIAGAGAWMVVRIGTGVLEATVELRPGQKITAFVDFPGLQLPDQVHCRIVGADPDDPRWQVWRELDGKGNLYLYGAPIEPFEVEIVVDGVAGEPIPVD